MKLILADQHHQWTDICQKTYKKWSETYKFRNQIVWHQTDIRQVSNLFRSENLAYVSPANSFGYMDGGIDLFYTRMFPKVQNKLQKQLKLHSKFVYRPNHRKVLPIGCAAAVDVTKHQQTPIMLISAPTMVHPGNVRDTRNAYYATLAALACAEQHKQISAIVFPGMCTGCGRMKLEDALNQMFEAIRDVECGRNPKNVSHHANFYIAENVLGNADIQKNPEMQKIYDE